MPSAVLDQLHRLSWQQRFDSATLERGRHYAERGQVLWVETEGPRIQAACRGSGAQQYQQLILLGELLQARCSCPVRHACKHCAAVLWQLSSGQRQPLPEQRIDDLQPRPCLQLASKAISVYLPSRGRMVLQHQHRAALSFDYAGQRCHGRSGQPARLQVLQDGQRLNIARQPLSEQHCREQLARHGANPAMRQSKVFSEGAGELYELASDAHWQQFVSQALPQLRAAGWQIERLPGFQFNLQQVQGWYAELDESPALDWFELQLGVLVEGRRISLLPALLQLLQQPEWLDPARRAELPDGHSLNLSLEPLDQQGQPIRVALPYSRLKPLLATLATLLPGPSDERTERLRLARADAALLAPLQAAQLDWQGGEQLRELARQLNRPASALPPPAGLNARLRPYQLAGLQWMQQLRSAGLGGVLADDMGLGKTLQCLAHILCEKQAGRLDRPALVVMPTSLIGNWRDEAARFAPQLRVLALHGSRRQADLARLQQYDLLLTSYALLPRDLPHWREQPLHLLLLDEAQQLKNPNSQASRAVQQLRARQRLALSGTPLENHLGELWALFNAVLPGWLGDARQFARNYRTPIEKQADPLRLQQLKARIRPFLLRRRKEQVASELPAKNEITHWVELGPAQRDLYESVRLSADRQVRAAIASRGLARSRINLLDALLKLRQVCCDPRLLGQPVGSAKFAALFDMLDELLAEGRRILLFSQFTSMLTLIAEQLDARDQPHALLTGSSADRERPVQRFQQGEVPLFLISLKAGGSGLNLTAADTVIHYDPWWNPAAEAQASDRAHRIGQDKPVFIYRLIARGTVEEKIQQLQERKAQLSHSLLDDAAQVAGTLDESDVQALLEPL